MLLSSPSSDETAIYGGSEPTSSDSGNISADFRGVEYEAIVRPAHRMHVMEHTSTTYMNVLEFSKSTKLGEMTPFCSSTFLLGFVITSSRPGIPVARIVSILDQLVKIWVSSLG